MAALLRPSTLHLPKELPCVVLRCGGALVVRLASDTGGTPKVAVMLNGQSTALPRGQALALR